MADAPKNVVERFYDFHPINVKQILDAVAARGITAGAITEEVLQQHDQDHYGGTAATDRLIAEALRSIAVPSLVLVGEHDRIYPVAKAREIHGQLEGSEFRILEAASHFPPYQNPERFAELVQEFVERRVEGA